MTSVARLDERSHQLCRRAILDRTATSNRFAPRSTASTRLFRYLHGPVVSTALPRTPATRGTTPGPERWTAAGCLLPPCPTPPGLGGAVGGAAAPPPKREPSLRAPCAAVSGHGRIRKRGNGSR